MPCVSSSASSSLDCHGTRRTWFPWEFENRACGVACATRAGLQLGSVPVVPAPPAGNQILTFQVEFNESDGLTGVLAGATLPPHGRSARSSKRMASMALVSSRMPPIFASYRLSILPQEQSRLDLTEIPPRNPLRHRHALGGGYTALPEPRRRSSCRFWSPSRKCTPRSEATSLHAHSNNAAFFLNEIASSTENSSLQFQSFGSALLQVHWHAVGAAYARSRSRLEGPAG